MKIDQPTNTPRFLYVATDGSYGDATGLRFIRADSSLLLSLPEDPSDAEMVAFAAEYGTTAPVSNPNSYYWQDLEISNIEDGVKSLRNDGWVGVVSENDGGIIAYSHQSNAERIVDALRAAAGDGTAPDNTGSPVAGA